MTWCDPATALAKAMAVGRSRLEIIVKVLNLAGPQVSLENWYKSTLQLKLSYFKKHSPYEECRHAIVIHKTISTLYYDLKTVPEEEIRQFARWLRVYYMNAKSITIDRMLRFLVSGIWPIDPAVRVLPFIERQLQHAIVFDNFELHNREHIPVSWAIGYQRDLYIMDRHYILRTLFSEYLAQIGRKHRFVVYDNCVC